MQEKASRGCPLYYISDKSFNKFSDSRVTEQSFELDKFRTVYQLVDNQTTKSFFPFVEKHYRRKNY